MIESLRYIIEVSLNLSKWIIFGYALILFIVMAFLKFDAEKIIQGNFLKKSLTIFVRALLVIMIIVYFCSMIVSFL